MLSRQASLAQASRSRCRTLKNAVAGSKPGSKPGKSEKKKYYPFQYSVLQKASYFEPLLVTPLLELK